MESSYFTSLWAHPSHHRYSHVPPSHTPIHGAKSSPVQKVIEIPVQYVSSNKPNQSDSAVKIQKVFRGYLVRKSVKKIEEIRRDVVEIENRVLEKESVELIKNDVNEQLRLNESLMSLLFKLDSVVGVDFCVRELRKRVTKRVIRLQEIVDEIVSSEQSKGDASGGESKEDVIADESVIEEAKLEAESNADLATDADVARRECSDEAAVSISEGFEESVSETDSNPLMEEEEKDECEEREEMEMQKCDEIAENKRSRELLERMVEDNEKMMGLMAELFERNEMQTRLLSALSQRVGRLEKAFMCERLRKKKKKNGSGGLVDCVESTKDHCYNKCGGKKQD